MEVNFPIFLIKCGLMCLIIIICTVVGGTISLSTKFNNKSIKSPYLDIEIVNNTVSGTTSRFDTVSLNMKKKRSANSAMCLPESVNLIEGNTFTSKRPSVILNVANSGITFRLFIYLRFYESSFFYTGPDSFDKNVDSRDLEIRGTEPWNMVTISAVANGAYWTLRVSSNYKSLNFDSWDKVAKNIFTNLIIRIEPSFPWYEGAVLPDCNLYTSTREVTTYRPTTSQHSTEYTNGLSTKSTSPKESTSIDPNTDYAQHVTNQKNIYSTTENTPKTLNYSQNDIFYQETQTSTSVSDININDKLATTNTKMYFFSEVDMTIETSLSHNFNLDMNSTKDADILDNTIYQETTEYTTKLTVDPSPNTTSSFLNVTMKYLDSIEHHFLRTIPSDNQQL